MQELDDLSKAVQEYINFAQMIKTCTFNTNDESLEIVLKYDKQITAAAIEYGVEKEMIQAILFQEIRFYGVEDPIADSLVVQSYVKLERA